MSVIVSLARLILMTGIVMLSGCGEFQPGTPGHEPAAADGRTNSVTHEINSSGR